MTSSGGPDGPLPYGAVDGERDGPVSPPPWGSGRWHTGQPVVVHANRYLSIALGLFAAVLLVLMVVHRDETPVLRWVYVALLVPIVVVLVETLVATVRVDVGGVARRSLRGGRTYGRTELDVPVLQRSWRRTRTGKQEVLRLTVRTAPGGYGFQMGSDLFDRRDVDRVAALVGAVRVESQRGADVEARFPGATRWVQRQPVWLLVLAAGGVWLGVVALAVLVLTL